MNFLGYVNTLIRELGVLGGEPLSTVLDQTGEAARIVGLVSDADWYISTRWDDLKYLWAQANSTATVGSNELLLPQAIGGLRPSRRIIRDSLILRPNTTSVGFPLFQDWNKFRQTLYGSAIPSSDYPAMWSERPDGGLVLTHKAVTSYAYMYEYMIQPSRLQDDADESLIPVNPDDQFDYPRIVIVKAKLAWGELEDAPEIVTSAVAEYRDLMASFEASYLPNREQHQMSRADQVMVMQR